MLVQLYNSVLNPVYVRHLNAPKNHVTTHMIQPIQFTQQTHAQEVNAGSVAYPGPSSDAAVVASVGVEGNRRSMWASMVAACAMSGPALPVQGWAVGVSRLAAPAACCVLVDLQARCSSVC